MHHSQTSSQSVLWQQFSAENHQRNLIWLLVLTVSIIFIGIGLRDPWPADEPRFALVAKEMVESGQWLFPSRGGEFYPDKPPIFMWSIAAFYALLGSIKWAFLLPSALAGLITVFAVYDIGRRLWSVQTGWYAALTLLLSLQFVLQAKTAQIDAMVCCWITLSCYSLLRFLLLKDGWRWYFLSFFLMGIGVITKGVGFLPLLMLIPYAIVRWRNPLQGEAEISGGWRWFVGPLAMLLAIGLWLVPMLIVVANSHDPALELYRDNILFRQTVTRYADSWHHIKPFWYYLVSVIPVFWLPLSVLLPWLFFHWKRAISQGDRRIILPLGWIVLTLLFFSLSPGKRGVYILPALPMLALISAPYIMQVITRKGAAYLIWAVVALLSVLFLTVGVGGAFDVPAMVKLTRDYPIEPWMFFSTVGLLGLLFCVVSFRRHPQVSWVLFIPGLWILYSTWGYSLLAPVKTPKPIYQQAANIFPVNAEVALVDFSEQFLLFSPYKMTHFGYHSAHDAQLKAAWLWLEQGQKRYVILSKDVLTDCFKPDLAVELGYAHRSDWVALDKHARLNQCLPEVQPAQSYQAKVP